MDLDEETFQPITANNFNQDNQADASFGEIDKMVTEREFL